MASTPFYSRPPQSGTGYAAAGGAPRTGPARRVTRSSRQPVAIVDALVANDAFAVLRDGVAQLQALEKDLAVCLPDYLRANVTPAGIQADTLTLLTPHNALAARLRHLAPTVVSTLQKRGWNVAAVKVRIRPAPNAAPPAPPKTARISATGLACLDALRDSLEPSPLRDALTAMVARHRPGHGQRS